MASFIGVAGLFILLLGDLMALLQIMMYIGGMLVMILFMVMFSHDPGGAMMAGMKMSPIEKFFSLGIPEEDMEGMQMDMQDMSMTTPLKKWAALLALATGAALCAILLLRPAWPIRAELPRTDAAAQVGNLLMGKYMMAFEGAGLLILIGIFGAVLLGRGERFPDQPGRDQPVAVDEAPAPLESEPAITDIPARELLPATTVRQAHRDEKE